MRGCSTASQAKSIPGEDVYAAMVYLIRGNWNGNVNRGSAVLRENLRARFGVDIPLGVRSRWAFLLKIPRGSLGTDLVKWKVLDDLDEEKQIIGRVEAFEGALSFIDIVDIMDIV